MAKDFGQEIDNGYIVPNSIAIGDGSPIDIRCQCDTVQDFKTFATNSGFDIRYEGLITYEKTNKKLKVYKGNDVWEDVVGSGGNVDLSDYVTLNKLATELAKKSDVHNHPYKSDSYVPTWNEVTGKPTTFNPSTHRHDASEIDNLPTSGGGSTVVVDNLTSTSATSALSANQGKVLNQNINALATEVKNDLLEGKKFRWKTQAEYDALSEEEKNDTTIEYHITDAEDTEAVDLALNGNVLKLKAKDGSTLGTGVTLPNGGGSSVTVENNLTSTSTTNALSANQGKVLKDEITVLNDEVEVLKNNQAKDSYSKSESDNRFRSKQVEITMDDLSEDVKNAMTGNTSIEIERDIFDFYRKSKLGKKIINCGDSTAGRIMEYLTEASKDIKDSLYGVICPGGHNNSGTKLSGFLDGSQSNNITNAINSNGDLYLFCYGINDDIISEEDFYNKLKTAVDRLLDETNGYIMLRTPNQIVGNKDKSNLLKRVYSKFKNYSKRIDVLEIQDLVFNDDAYIRSHFMQDSLHPSVCGSKGIFYEIKERMCVNGRLSDQEDYDNVKAKGYIYEKVNSNTIRVGFTNTNFTPSISDSVYIGDRLVKVTGINLLPASTIPYSPTVIGRSFELILGENYDDEIKIVRVVSKGNPIITSYDNCVNDWCRVSNMNQGHVYYAIDLNSLGVTEKDLKIKYKYSYFKNGYGNDGRIDIGMSFKSDINWQNGVSKSSNTLRHNKITSNNGYFEMTNTNNLQYLIIMVSIWECTTTSDFDIGGMVVNINGLDVKVPPVQSVSTTKIESICSPILITEQDVYSLLEKLGLLGGTTPPPTIYGNIVVSNTSLSVNENSNTTFTVKLDKAPTNNQVINLSINNAYCTINKTSLTFTPSNYSTTQSVTVTGVHDVSSYSDKTSVITISSNNVASKTVSISINNIDEIPGEPTLVESVNVSPKIHTLKVGEKVQITETVLPSNATNKSVTWSVSNSNCSVVNGLVTAISEGECVVTCTTVDGNYTDICNITIEPKQEVVEEFTVEKQLYSSDIVNTGDGITGHVFDFYEYELEFKLNQVSGVEINPTAFTSTQWLWFVPKEIGDSTLTGWGDLPTNNKKITLPSVTTNTVIKMRKTIDKMEVIFDDVLVGTYEFEDVSPYKFAYKFRIYKGDYDSAFNYLKVKYRVNENVDVQKDIDYLNDLKSASMSNYELYDDFNRGSLGDTSANGKTYVVEGSPTISSNILKVGGANKLLYTPTIENFEFIINSTKLWYNHHFYIKYVDSNNYLAYNFQKGKLIKCLNGNKEDISIGIPIISSTGSTLENLILIFKLQSGILYVRANGRICGQLNISSYTQFTGNNTIGFGGEFANCGIDDVIIKQL